MRRRNYKYKTALALSLPPSSSENPKATEDTQPIQQTSNPLESPERIMMNLATVSHKLPPSLTNLPVCDSPQLVKDIKFRSIGKRTVAGVKNGVEKVNQDAIFIDTNILGKKFERVSVFAVFDGHG